jgi:hypothetical protein
MAEYGHYETLTMVSATDLSGQLYHLVRISDGNDGINVASQSTNSGLLGVLVTKPEAAGRHATVAYQGMGKVVAGTAINSAGVFFTCNGSGRAVAAGSGDMVAGRILETATADGDVVSVLLYPPFRLSGAV